jgi:hypothetical protein
LRLAIGPLSYDNLSRSILAKVINCLNTSGREKRPTEGLTTRPTEFNGIRHESGLIAHVREQYSALQNAQRMPASYIVLHDQYADTSTMLRHGDDPTEEEDTCESDSIEEAEIRSKCWSQDLKWRDFLEDTGADVMIVPHCCNTPLSYLHITNCHSARLN